jgi:hypothetical protein
MRDDLKTLLERPPQIEFTSRAELALSHARKISAKYRDALRALIKDDVNIIEGRLREERPPLRSHLG